MLEALRHRVGVSYAQLHFRNNGERIMNFTNALSRAKKALIIFPEILIDRDTVISIFHYLLKKFTPNNTTLIIRDDQLFSLNTLPSLKTITYSKTDLNSWFLPRHRLVHKIRKTNFDVALDLNIDFSLPSAFLCKKSNAPIRISFEKKNGDRFYNFQIRTKEENDSLNKYKSLLKCLDMF